MEKITIGCLSEVALYGDLPRQLDALGTIRDLSSLSGAALREALADVDVLLHHPRVHVDATLVEAAPKLRAILAPGAGFDGVDLSAATQAGVLVTNQPGCNAQAVAEHVIGLLLGVSKRIVEGDRLVRSDQPWTPGTMMNHEVSGRTLGIIGLGAIGKRLASMAAAAFSLEVVACDPVVDQADVDVELVTLEQLLRRSSLVSLHVPLTPATRHMIGGAELALLPTDAILVNTSRGDVVDQQALVAALEAGSLGGAGLDVVQGEEVAADDPLLASPNVVITPHSAGATYEAVAAQADRQAAAVADLREGRVPRQVNVLNQDAVQGFLDRFSA